MRILLASDAWKPQINGVVRTIEETVKILISWGIEVELFTPEGYGTFPMPGYGEIGLALIPPHEAARRIEKARPDHIHIATEGPIGLALRKVCLDDHLPFTTSFHTRYPEYVSARLPLVPKAIPYAYLRWFHAPALATMVPSQSIADTLIREGFKPPLVWSRGVDIELFNGCHRAVIDAARPYFIYAGRVAIEKNLDAFLALDLPGTKIIVGDGPDRLRLQSTYPQARFLGFKDPSSLAEIFAAGDVFVFPSLTDTFGIVMIEAMACGLPVAAFPVSGPMDSVGSSGAGLLHEDLRVACIGALAIDKANAIEHARQFTWRASAQQFVDAIYKVRPELCSHKPASRKTICLSNEKQNILCFVETPNFLPTI